MSAPPYMPLYVADYIADTGHLSTLEHGAYLLLLMHHWRAGSLPKDDRALANIARLSARNWASIRMTMQKFFDAEWRHKRVIEELEKSRLKSEIRSEVGSRGGRAKALRSKYVALANATNLPEQNPSAALPSSSDQLDTIVSNSGSSASSGDLSPFDDGLVEKLFQAAQGNVGKRCIGISAIRRRLEEGADLESDVLRTVRDLVPKLKSPLISWAAPWLLKGISNAMQARSSPATNTQDHQPGANALADSAPQIWIPKGSQAFDEWRLDWIASTGRDRVGLRVTRNSAGEEGIWRPSLTPPRAEHPPSHEGESP